MDRASHGTGVPSVQLAVLGSNSLPCQSLRLVEPFTEERPYNVVDNFPYTASANGWLNSTWIDLKVLGIESLW